MLVFYRVELMSRQWTTDNAKVKMIGEMIFSLKIADYVNMSLNARLFILFRERYNVYNEWMWIVWTLPLCMNSLFLWAVLIM